MTMIRQLSFDLFVLSLLVVLLVLMVLLLLCWVLKHNRNRNVTELQISGGHPCHILTVRTNPDHASQLLDQLLDRVFLQMEAELESGGESTEELRQETEEELGGESGSDPGLSEAASLPRRALNVVHSKLSQWNVFGASALHEKKKIRTPPVAPPLTPPIDQDKSGVPCSQKSDATQLSLSSLGISSGASWNDDETQSYKA